MGLILNLGPSTESPSKKEARPASCLFVVGTDGDSTVQTLFAIGDIKSE